MWYSSVGDPWYLIFFLALDILNKSVKKVLFSSIAFLCYTNIKKALSTKIPYHLLSINWLLAAVYLLAF